MSSYAIGLSSDRGLSWRLKLAPTFMRSCRPRAITLEGHGLVLVSGVCEHNRSTIGSVDLWLLAYPLRAVNNLFACLALVFAGAATTGGLGDERRKRVDGF